jgi:hypothetical protein
VNNIIGIAWYKDKATYCRALDIFTDPASMPTTFEDWRVLVARECELIKYAGNVALRADIDPEAFVDWCASHGFRPDSQGRTAFVNHVVLEYEKTGKGTLIE